MASAYAYWMYLEQCLLNEFMILGSNKKLQQKFKKTKKLKIDIFLEIEN